MKIRNGFISNSSASSFIVQTKKDKFDMIMEKEIGTLDQEQVKLLKENGFAPTTTSDPFSFLELNRRSWPDSKGQEEDIDNDVYMALMVACNQDEIIYLLVKNNIPFKAACHYGQEFICYEKDSDYMFKANNFGMEACMYGAEHVEEDRFNSPKFERIDVKGWMEKEEPVLENEDED
ncbi:MAG: hypothetical protein ACTSSP_00240 [Candidatus Asgardarchaeia archaeon]